MALAAKLYADKRLAERHPVDLDGTLRGVDRTPVDVQLDNLSSTGCQLSGSVALEAGDLVTIGVTGVGIQPARIIHVADDRYGCQFLNPMSDTDVGRAFDGEAPVIVELPLTAPLPLVEGDIVRDRKYPRSVRLIVIAGCIIVGWLAVLFSARLLLG